MSTEKRTPPREQGDDEDRVVYMRPSTQPRPAASIEAGHEALAQGAWAEARACFEAALEGEETPEALEGLSWSAWWLDDASAVFDARGRAYRLYRKRRDAAGAARMATWLAVDHLDFHGALAVASGWLQRTHRLLDPLEPGPEHGWLAFLDGYVASMRGDAVKAEELGAYAAELGRRFEVPDLEMLGLALEGATLVARARVEEGMRRLDEATALALEGQAEVPISSAWACCFLVTACTAARDYERALEWCDRIAEFAERYGSRYMLGFCRAEYGAVHLWRGRWTEAEALLRASAEDFSRSRPAMVGAPLVGLAELRRRQGRRAEAEALLVRVGPSSKAVLCRARLAFDQGDALRAVELIERLLRQLPADGVLDRAPALEPLVSARVVRGELHEAASALAALREIGRLVGTPPLRASADLAEGMLEAARGEHDRARALLEDAVDRFQRSGVAIFTGCSHAGLLNICGHAQDIFPDVPLYAVVGGLHLVSPNEDIIRETIAELHKFGLKVIIPGHCTGWRAVHALVGAFGEEVVDPLAVGSRQTL